MNAMRAIQRLLARCGVMAYRRKYFPVGIDVMYDLQRLFGEVGLVLDVGANRGDMALQFAKAFPAARVCSFEPVPATFGKLKSATAGGATGRWFPGASGSRAHSTTIRLNANEHNSLLQETGERGAGTADISVTTGDAWAESEGVTSIDLLKIDTEGYDLEVLKGFRGMLSRGAIEAILVECEFARVTPEPHTSFFDLHAFLTGCGMRLITIYTDCATAQGFAWGNALFGRIQQQSSVHVPVEERGRAGPMSAAGR